MHTDCFEKNLSQCPFSTKQATGRLAWDRTQKSQREANDQSPAPWHAHADRKEAELYSKIQSVPHSRHTPSR